MQVVIGGAHNGKRRFVKEQLGKDPSRKLYFFDGVLPENNEYTKDDYVVVGGLEKLIQASIHLDEEAIVSTIYDALVRMDRYASIICICTDFGRGIVPLHADDRKLRDACGRLYQKLFRQSDDVIRVWYGIPEVLKGKGW